MGLIPRGLKFGDARNNVNKVNMYLARKSLNRNITFMQQDSDWITEDGHLRKHLFYNDNIHLCESGFRTLSQSILKTMLLSKPFKPPPLSLKPISFHPSPNYPLPRAFPLHDDYAIGQSEYLGSEWDGEPSHQPSIPHCTPFPTCDDFLPLPKPSAIPISLLSSRSHWSKFPSRRHFSTTCYSTDFPPIVPTLSSTDPSTSINSFINPNISQFNASSTPISSSWPMHSRESHTVGRITKILQNYVCDPGSCI